MKLIASIEPAEEGNIVAEFGDDKYEFTLDSNGDISGEVSNDEHVALLLESGNFYPADEADFDQASDLLSEDKPKRGRKPKEKVTE